MRFKLGRVRLRRTGFYSPDFSPSQGYGGQVAGVTEPPERRLGLRWRLGVRSPRCRRDEIRTPRSSVR